ncbi:signal peptidase I [Candidatus Pacearchaeota archaeon CG10_big_fil_rev_8_21_14_0_10_32_42]|nr:MAG: signal peptidase I [Candidatus Pacearchaeota archaeon CG10_big_fil_rev_8_21_14_0_10_32_42]
MNKETWKDFWKKFWFVVWKDDSLKGWIISFIFLLIIIRGIFFPLLSLVTGTPLPLAIVESCSMYHKGNILSDFDGWWKNHEGKYFMFGISNEEFGNFHFKNGFNKGDILFVTGIKPENVQEGDIIIFDAGGGTPIIHRVVNLTLENGEYYFSTIGDNNNGQLAVETRINENQIVGKPRANILPYLGWIKLIFFEGTKSPQQRGFCSEN